MPGGPQMIALGSWEPSQVSVSWRQDQYDPGPEANAAADELLRELKLRGSPSHDGLAARMVGCSASDDELHLELQPIRWSLRLVAGSGAGDSISSMCVVRSADGRWLAGRRAQWVATWQGRWTLGAGGAVEVGENPAQTLSRELLEEWSVTPERLTVEGLFRSPGGQVFLIGLAQLPPGAEVTLDPEHDTYAWWPAQIESWPPEAEPELRALAQLVLGNMSNHGLGRFGDTDRWDAESV